MVDTTPNGVACVSKPDAASGSEALVVVVELRRVSGAIDPMLIKGKLLKVLGVRADVIVFVPAGVLPRTTSGKVKRRELATGWERLQQTPSPPAEERVGVRRRATAAEIVTPHPDPLPREGEREKVFILGAGGFLGLNTVRAFLDAGLTPTCGRRARGNVLGLRGLGCPLAVTDFADVDALAASFAGTDVLVHAAGHYPRFSLELSQTLQRGLAELETVLDAAAKAKVKRLVFVSSTATIAPRDERASTEADAFAAAPEWGTYHALKWHLEARLAREDRLEVVIANPAACLGPFDWKVGTSALLLATARGTPPPHPEGRITTVDARDVGAALVKLATLPSPPRRLIIANESADAHELLVMLARRYGAPPPPAPLSPAAARALADAQEHEAARTGGRALLARAGRPHRALAAPRRLAQPLAGRQLPHAVEHPRRLGRVGPAHGDAPPTTTGDVRMTNEVLTQRIFSMMSQLTLVKQGDIKLEHRLREDLGLDSVCSMELLSMLAEDLDLDVPMEEAAQITTVAGTIEMARRHLELKRAQLS